MVLENNVMKVQTASSSAAAANDISRPSLGLRILFLLAGAAVVIVAQSPIAALAARVIS
jgi:hypothetical protein